MLTGEACNLTNATTWKLTGKSSEVAQLGDISISNTPFRIGRNNGLELTLAIQTVSGNHAVIDGDGDELMIADMGSRNGTFVNGNRIRKATQIMSGDLIQIAESLFRLQSTEPENVGCKTLEGADLEEALAFVEFDTLLSDRLIYPVFQPIVDLSSRKPIGYESLIRSDLEKFKTPAMIFHTAERLQQEAEVSRLAREVAGEQAHLLPDLSLIFLNTHPCELNEPKELIRSMQHLKSRFPNVNFVLEIHESTVTDSYKMQFLRSEMDQLGFEIAYDDFGVGQSRYVELIEEPPAYLKYDVRLIRGINKAASRRVRAIGSLVKMVKGLGITCLAEGIENEAEAKECTKLGFQLGQGFHLGRPAKPNSDDDSV